MVQLTTASKKLLVKIFDLMNISEKARFGRDLKVLWDKIITGDEQREFKITPDDIQFVIAQGGYVVPVSFITK